MQRPLDPVVLPEAGRAVSGADDDVGPEAADRHLARWIQLAEPDGPPRGHDGRKNLLVFHDPALGVLASIAIWSPHPETSDKPHECLEPDQGVEIVRRRNELTDRSRQG